MCLPLNIQPTDEIANVPHPRTFSLILNYTGAHSPKIHREAVALSYTWAGHRSQTCLKNGSCDTVSNCSVMGFGAAQVNQNLEHQSLKHLEFAVSPQGNFHLASSPQGNFRLKETCATRGAVARAPDTGRENSLRQGRQAAWIFGNLRFYSLRRRCHFHHLAIFKLRSARLLQDRSKSVETDTPIPSVGGARRLANSGAPRRGPVRRFSTFSVELP